VHECPSARPLWREFFDKYKDRLQKAGCQRIVYINRGRRLNLTTKWKEIAQAARGEVLIMHDSDDYTHPLRIQKTMEYIKGFPWYDTRYAWHYSIPLNKMIIYDYMVTKKRWKTGFNIGLLTEVLRGAKDTKKNAGIHKWLSYYVKTKYVDQTMYPCIATTGANTVSLNRTRHFHHPSPPFVRTDKTIHEIGLPKDIVARLLKNDSKSALEVHRAQDKVEVEFLRPYCRLYKKGDIKRIPWMAAERMLKKNQIRIVKEEKMEPIKVVI
jgi:glycosyltransferase involved in cell wall biosynthesis